MPALIALCVLWAVVVAVTGGFDGQILGTRIKSTSPDRAAYLAALLAFLYAYFYRADARRRARALDAWAAVATRLEWVAPALVLVLSVVVFVLGVRQGSLVAQAADAWGYLSQADLWRARDLIVEQPVARRMPWPLADWTFAPLGYRPALSAGAIVPAYPPGLPVLMAVAKDIAGACGPFLITPLLGGLTVWLTYLLGVRFSSRLIGLAGAALLATSPIFLLMVLSPFSDVPATAFLVLGLVLALTSWRSRAFWTGAATSMAIFIRPNLVLVGAVFLAFIVLSAVAAEGESQHRARWRAFVWFSLGGAPLILGVAALNAVLYGAPWRGGHGRLEELYSWRYVWRNLIDYPRWMWTFETPLIALSVVPLIVWRRDRERRPRLVLAASFVAAVGLSYLFYRAFGLWLYLRFLLPAIPLLLVLAVMGLMVLLARIEGVGERVAVALLVLILAFSVRLGVLRHEQILSHWREGVPYTSVGEFVRRQLPANAVVITVQHSGSIRYYADRLTLRWDYLDPEWFPRAAEVLNASGYRPYVLLASFEEDAFRSRFGLSSVDDAPGRLVATFPGSEVNRLYDPLRRDSAIPTVIPTTVTYPCACLQPDRTPE